MKDKINHHLIGRYKLENMPLKLLNVGIKAYRGFESCQGAMLLFVA
jgi:hypothetical protein